MSYERLIDTMLRLSQGLTGLRAGCALQNELMDAEREGKLDDRAPNDSEKDRLMEQLMVLAKFKERVGGSLEALTVGSLSTRHLQFSSPESELTCLSLAVDIETRSLLPSDLLHPHQGWP